MSSGEFAKYWREHMIRYLRRWRVKLVVSGIVLALFIIIIISIPNILERHAGNVEIEYYGIVVDQAGKGVSNLPISAELLINPWQSALPLPLRSMLSISHIHESVEVRTDRSGRFVIHRARGVYLSRFHGPDGMRPDKSEDSGAEYAYVRGGIVHIPDPQKPVVFRCWRSESSEMPILWTARRAADGADGGVRLNAGLWVESRSAIQPSSDIAARCSYRSGSVWPIDIIANRGSLLETASVVRGEVPAGEYRTRYTYTNGTEAADNRGVRFKKTYYYKAENPSIYAIVTIILNSNSPPTFEYQWIANTKGSDKLDDPGEALRSIP